MMLCFGVAKELGMTVERLWREATREEILGWSCYFQITHEQREREMNRISNRRR